MNLREYFYDRFETGDIPTQEEYMELFLSIPFLINDISELPEAHETRAGQVYQLLGAEAYRCELINDTWQWVKKTTGSSGGTNNYGDLQNKPSLNKVMITGAKTHADYGIMPDFNNLKVTGNITDDKIIIIGNLKNEKWFCHISDLAKFVAKYLGTVGAVKQPLIIQGTQDGSNLTFTTAEKYYLTTSSLYLNGQRMIPGIDYNEVDENTFEFREVAPNAEDRMFFEAIMI
jgi:hypothetical protein